MAKASSNFASLRTVVPMSIVRQWQLKEGDHIDWSWEARNREMVVVIKKVDHFGNQAGTNTQIGRKTRKTIKKN